MTESPKYSDREAQAMAEVGRTAIRPITAWLLTVVFICIIGVVPVTQYVVEIRDNLTGRRESILPPCCDILRSPPGFISALTQPEQPLFRRIVEANRCLLRAMHTYEDNLENDSVIDTLIRPPTQYVMARWLGAGNDQAYCGWRPWLFYRPDIDYLTQPGFLEPKQQVRQMTGASEWRSSPQPDPAKAILHFKNQLARRGIALIVVPTPIKPMIHPERFSRAYANWPLPLHNPSYARFVADLQQANVLVFDIARELVNIRQRTGQPQYLTTDTHWQPAAMEYTARRLNNFIETRAALPPVPHPEFQCRRTTVSYPGDIALMLKLPANQTAYPPETVTLRQVLAPRTGLGKSNNNYWQPATNADVLVLGDSFCNIYSLESLGWGKSAGFIEQLSWELKRPLDRITLNDNGAFATRTALARELARGQDRLAGKRLVIYQFAVRELAVGDWKLVNLTVGKPPVARFIVPPAGAIWTARGMIKDVSPVPRPGTVPYKDHLLSLHLVNVKCRDAGITNGQAVVYLWSMRDNVWTPAARRRHGDMIEVKLRPWSDVASSYEGINRSDPEDFNLQLQEPCWSEKTTSVRE